MRRASEAALESDRRSTLWRCAERDRELRRLKRAPDVCLDVRLPDLDGVWRSGLRLDRNRRPCSYFRAWFGTFAVRAFESEAADYLLKPFQPWRLDDGAARAGIECSLRKATHGQRRPGRNGRLRLNAGPNIIVKTSEVEDVCGGITSEVHVWEGSHLMRTTGGALWLDFPKSFRADQRSVW
jgi:DNA-binding LytR/AlgR family response regulator